MRGLLLLTVLMLGIIGFSTAVSADDGFRVAYEGELINPDGSPVAGVMAFTYQLYAGEDVLEPMWVEEHYVSVIEGSYNIILGSINPLDRLWRGDQYILGVVFNGYEILREPINLEPMTDESNSTNEEERLNLMAQAFQGGTVTEVTFAELADRSLFAQQAERCDDADRLGGRRLREIEDQIEQVLNRLSEHESNNNVHSAGGQVGMVGRSNTVLPRIGGDGGVRYTSMCPTGYVMVGIRGGAGNVVDSFEVVCAPLQ
jgi:hypothetical protein